MSAELRVGDIRREIEGLPDDAPVFVSVPGGYDCPITWAAGGSQIIDPADAEKDEDGHWPTRPGLELHAQPEWPQEELAAVEDSVRAGLFSCLSYDFRRRMGLARKVTP